MNKTVAFHTLGCKLNFAESSDLSRKFVEAGYRVVDFKTSADVYVINTCTVTSMAEKKCRHAIRQAMQLNPQAQIAVVGCFSQLRPEEIAALEGVHYILGNAEKHKLLDYLAKDEFLTPPREMGKESFVASYSSDDRTRAFLKVQDGCNYFCTYCAIPFARGRNRSDSVAATVENARRVAQQGMKEVVLTGVNIGEYGRERGETFIELLQALDKVEGIERYRISSIEPNLLTDEILDFVSYSRAFLPHFHIPLQAGSDEILEAMRRKYHTADFADRVQAVKQRMPDAFVAADIIVGFPGENEALFQQAYAFVEKLPLAYLHVFPYSERPQTVASTLPGKIRPAEKKIRSQVMNRLSKYLLHDFYVHQQGQVRPALWESTNEEGYMSGFTDNYLKVKTKFDLNKINTVEKVPLERLSSEGFFEVE